MHLVKRRGEINRLQIILLPPAIFFSGLILYNVYKWFSPSALTINSSKQVEALEIMRGVSPTKKNGLIVDQADSLQAMGNSRLVVTRPAKDGAFRLVSGRIALSYLLEKIGMDRNLRVNLTKNELRVLADGKAVDAVVLLPRNQTDPLRVDAPSLAEDQELTDVIFTNQTLTPIPKGKVEDLKFTGDSGLTVDVGFGVGEASPVSLLTGGGGGELHIKLDANSSAWVEAPSTIRVQNTAVGAEDVDIGLLIPHSGGAKTYEIHISGESVATVSVF